MKSWHFFSGSLQVRTVCASPQDVMDAAMDQGIELRSIQRESELCFQLMISRTDWPLWKNLVKRAGGKTTVIRREGIYWLIRAMKARTLLLAGISLLIIASIWISNRILFIQVLGAHRVSTGDILQAAQDAGLYIGASRRELRSEQIKNQLLTLVPELSWAGINTSGCVAEISVQERASKTIREEHGGVSHIVAARDGFILSGTTVHGSAQFHPGQSVQEGDVLISGYTDCGICIQATAAEGEVWAETSRDFQAALPGAYIQRGDEQSTGRKISLLIGKKRINLWKDSGISPTTCGRMYEEYYVTLPGSFLLPIALCVDTWIQYDAVPVQWERDGAENLLSEFAGNYLPSQMAAGSVRESKEQFQYQAGTWILRGNYVCEEMIARQQAVKIGD